MELNLDIFRHAIMECQDGVTVADMRLPDAPLVFVYPGFDKLTGYSAEECLGKNCRFLKGDESDAQASKILRDAVNNNEPCLVTVRNYRKDGTAFYNELSLSPIFSIDGNLTHYIGIQKDVTDRIKVEKILLQKTTALIEANKELEQLAITDNLTGVYNRRYFDMQIDIQMQIGKRNKHTISLFLVDIDHFKSYNDYYGHQAGDAALTAVAKSLGKSFRRSGDFVSRYGGEEFALLASHMTTEQATIYAQSLCQQVRELNIEHKGVKSAATESQFLSVSIGYATCDAHAVTAKSLIALADKALYRAKLDGRNRARGH